MQAGREQITQRISPAIDATAPDLGDPRRVAGLRGFPTIGAVLTPTRIAALATAPLVVLLALVLRATGTGAVAQDSGTLLYASLVYVAVVFIRPRLSPLWSGAVAVGFCWLVEFSQLTGVPARLSAHSLVARLVLGSQFDRHDVAWYPVGIVPLVAVHLYARYRVRAARAGRAA